MEESGQFDIARRLAAEPSTAPRGRLGEMELEADLVFKARVLSNTAIPNEAFPEWGRPHSTKLEIISLLKGNAPGKVVEFQHLTHGPNAWGGGRPPPDFVLEVGTAYIIFASNAGKPDWLYSPGPNAVSNTTVFRQLMKGEVPLRTVDSTALTNVSASETYWLELKRLLRDSNPTNQLYAIERLDSLSLAGRRDDSWRRSDDFVRVEVLRELLPCVQEQDERVALKAIECFEVEPLASEVVAPFKETLMGIANKSGIAKVRLQAISVLAGTHFEGIAKTLKELLADSNPGVRSRAVALLAKCPVEFSEHALLAAVEDPSPRVRAQVADVIGQGKILNLLPKLMELFADPVGPRQPVEPLTIEALEGGARITSTDGGVTMMDDPNGTGANVGDVHTSSGYALLAFDVGQVGYFLKTNLADVGFRLQFLLKLSEVDPKPWIKDMARIMVARRIRNLKKAELDGFPPETYMYLSGAYNRCWHLMYDYLEKLPGPELSNAENQSYLQVLEQAGNTGSQEPIMIYELYRSKGLGERANNFRRQSSTYSGQNLEEFFNRIDSRFPTQGGGTVK